MMVIILFCSLTQVVFIDRCKGMDFGPHVGIRLIAGEERVGEYKGVGFVEMSQIFSFGTGLFGGLYMELSSDN